MTARFLLNHPSLPRLQGILDEVAKTENPQMAIVLALLASTRYGRMGMTFAAGAAKTEHVRNFLTCLKKELAATQPHVLEKYPVLNLPSRQTVASGLLLLEQLDMLGVFLAWMMSTNCQAAVKAKGGKFKAPAPESVGDILSASAARQKSVSKAAPAKVKCIVLYHVFEMRCRSRQSNPLPLRLSQCSIGLLRAPPQRWLPSLLFLHAVQSLLGQQGTCGCSLGLRR